MIGRYEGLKERAVLGVKGCANNYFCVYKGFLFRLAAASVLCVIISLNFFAVFLRPSNKALPNIVVYYPARLEDFVALNDFVEKYKDQINLTLVTTGGSMSGDTSLVNRFRSDGGILPNSSQFYLLGIAGVLIKAPNHYLVQRVYDTREAYWLSGRTYTYYPDRPTDFLEVMYPSASPLRANPPYGCANQKYVFDYILNDMEPYLLSIGWIK